MEYSLHVNQLALKRWVGKIDGDDCLLIAFIASLNPENDRVKKYMKDGYFRLNRTYLKQEMPILNFSEDWISRRMKRLQDCGLLDLQHFRNPSGTPLLYGRMSKLYWRDLERAKAHSDALKPASEDSHRDDCPSGTRDRRPTDDCPIDQLTDQRETDAPPLLAAGCAPSSEEFPAPEARTEHEALLGAARMKQRLRLPLTPLERAALAREESGEGEGVAPLSVAELAERQRVLTMNARLLGEHDSEREPALQGSA